MDVSFRVISRPTTDHRRAALPLPACGEVGICALFAQIPGEGPLHESEFCGKGIFALSESALAERPPHPDPLHASGEREHAPHSLILAPMRVAPCGRPCRDMHRERATISYRYLMNSHYRFSRCCDPFDWRNNQGIPDERTRTLSDCWLVARGLATLRGTIHAPTSSHWRHGGEGETFHGTLETERTSCAQHGLARNESSTTPCAGSARSRRRAWQYRFLVLFAIHV